MANIKINRCTNANVYIDGTSFLGRAEEVNLPSIKYKKAEHKGLGLVGALEFTSGIEKMEAKIKWNSFYEDVMKATADPFKTAKLMVRANVEVRSASGVDENLPLVCYMDVTSTSFPLGNFKQHENVELETELSVHYAKLVIGGVEVLEFDAMNNIYKVDGEDLLAEYRTNIGG